MRWVAAIACALLLAAPAEARKRRRQRLPQDARTAGLGKSCKSNAGCRHRAQVCLRESDANGKKLALGFCALPCAAIDAGLKRDDPAPDLNSKKATPPRCPKRYECRSAGNGVPIDMCVKQ